MIIMTNTFIPYELDKHDTAKYIEDRCLGLKKALRQIEKDTEHLIVRCPVSGDYLAVSGTAQELEWLNKELVMRGLYKPIS